MINLDELLSILRVGGAFYVDTQDKSTFTPFAFVLNVKRLKGDRAIELAPGCTLRRAKGSEISFIREWVAKYIGATSHDIWEARPPKPGTKSVDLSKLCRFLVPKKGLEPPHPCEYVDLNHARLPIPPLRHETQIQRYPLDRQHL